MGLFKKKTSKMNINDYNRLSMYNNLYMENRSSVIMGWKNLKNNHTGRNAVNYEKLCLTNIQQYYEWMQEGTKHPGFQKPTQVDAFMYLAMLYERQGRFQDAVDTCEEAIAAGATYDGTKGGMVGRLNRMKKKLAAAK